MWQFDCLSKYTIRMRGHTRCIARRQLVHLITYRVWARHWNRNEPARITSWATRAGTDLTKRAQTIMEVYHWCVVHISGTATPSGQAGSYCIRVWIRSIWVEVFVQVEMDVVSRDVVAQILDNVVVYNDGFNCVSNSNGYSNCRNSACQTFDWNRRVRE